MIDRWGLAVKNGYLKAGERSRPVLGYPFHKFPHSSSSLRSREWVRASKLPFAPLRSRFSSSLSRSQEPPLRQPFFSLKAISRPWTAPSFSVFVYPQEFLMCDCCGFSSFPTFWP